VGTRPPHGAELGPGADEGVGPGRQVVAVDVPAPLRWPPSRRHLINWESQDRGDDHHKEVLPRASDIQQQHAHNPHAARVPSARDRHLHRQHREEDQLVLARAA
jgi:hypothetical protein